MIKRYKQLNILQMNNNCKKVNIKTFLAILISVIVSIQGVQGQVETIGNRLDTKGMKQGRWCFYNANTGTFIETEYKDDTENGLRIEYLKSGKIVKESDYRAGKLDGYARYYNERNSKLFLIEYYEDGIIKHVFKFDKRGRFYYDSDVNSTTFDGTYRDYTINNKLSRYRTYNDGILDGETIVYKRGEKKILFVYQNGKIINVVDIIFDEIFLLGK